MALSNTAVPKYYGEFRDAVIRGEIPVCKEIEMEMNRIDDLIANPGMYYDDLAVEGFISYCEHELTLTDGSDLKLLDTFKVWAEEIFGWYYFEEKRVYIPYEDGHGGHYVTKSIKRRLVNKQYLIVDEWLSGDIREDVIGAIEQGASKVEDYLIVAISSEGTVRNGAGDTIKMELMDILKGDYINPHVSIWWYKLDSIDEVGDPDKWLKANPNLGKTVRYETYQLDVERAEKAPAARNDILAKRFGLKRH